MSKFLGPIHHWLFKKVKLFESLEQDIVRRIQGEHGEEISQVHSQTKEQWGEPTADKPLEDLIDTDNIHGWLQDKIAAAELRQAGLVTWILSHYGEEGLETVMDCYESQGEECGKDAGQQYEVSNAMLLHRVLNEYLLEGMPCDNVNNLTVSQEELLEWRVEKCLHKGYWEQVGGNVEIFYQLREKWTAAFVANANPDFEYRMSRDPQNTSVLIHQIRKIS